MNHSVEILHMRNRLAALPLLFSIVLGLMFAVSSPARAGIDVESWTTANGARVLFLQTDNLPIIDVSVEFPAGSARDLPGKEGLASMTLSLMNKGTRSLDENQISERLAGVGAELSGNFDLDRSGFSLRSLSDADARNSALAVFGEILASPSFPQAVLEREKARRIDFIKERATRPGFIVEQAFEKALYGTHPYANSGSGDPQSVAGLTRDDLVAFYRRHFVSNEAVVTIVGNVSKDEAQSIAKELTADLPRAKQPLPPIPEVAALTENKEEVIAHSSSQAHIRVGMLGVRRGDPDYFPLWVGVQILGGGGMTSLLNEELREKRGLTYGVYGYLSPYSRRGPFEIELQTRMDQAWKALDLTRTTLEKYLTDGPTQEQLQAAKQYIIGGFGLNIDSNAELVRYLAMIGFYGLPLDYMDRFPDEIEKVTLEQVRDALRRRFLPSKTVTVVVGPAARP
jgi:zinc protease